MPVPAPRTPVRFLRLLPALLLLALAAAACTHQPVAPAEAPAGAVSSPVWERDMERFAAEDAQHPPARGAVVFVGSSSIRLWEHLDRDFAGTAVVNRGFGGSEIRDSTWYADRIVIPLAPRTVVLYAGENDLNSGRTPEQVRTDFRAFVQRLRRDLPGTKIAYISIKPSPSRAHLTDAMRQANALVREEAVRWKDVDFIDVFTPMLGPDGQGRPELFGPDMLHMNQAGYALWTQQVAPYLSR